jgi:hypothetical protein
VRPGAAFAVVRATVSFALWFVLMPSAKVAPVELKTPPPRAGEVAALPLAIAALLVGLATVGRIPGASLSGSFTPSGLGSALLALAFALAAAMAGGS